MFNKREYTLKISTILIAILLITSSVLLMINSVPKTSAQTSNADLLQYEWPQLGHDGGWTLHSDGPAPDQPIVAWTQQVQGLSAGFAGTITAFNGMVFALTSTRVVAFDAFTGVERWTYTDSEGQFQSSPTKIDNTYMFIDGDSGRGGLGIGNQPGLLTNATITVLRISDGSFVSNITITGVGFQPGAGGYFPGRYDADLQMKYIRGYNAQTNRLSYYAVDLSDPTNPEVAWQTIFDESAEELSVGGGIVVIGTVNGAVIGMNASTGDVLWRALKRGFAQYTATYVDGSFIQGSASTTLTRYNATTGEIIWDKEQGGRAFFAFAGATAYGRFYQHNIAVDPAGFIACWDVETGDMLWKQPALYNIGYITPVVADGKVYLQRYVGTAAGLEAETSTFACFDAFTGDTLWEMPGVSIVNPSVAYGNLYTIIGNRVYCFSDNDPQDWNMWRGNLDQPGISQSTGPLCLAPDFVFTTDGPISGSPVVVDGKAYFGSQDNNIYCVDANDGTLIWHYTTGYRVFSTPAVVGGRLYTGADDGSIHALNANTGEEIWTQPAGGITSYVFAATWQPRSSPIVVGDRLYVGSLDGKLYCLDTGSGSVQWALPLGNATYPIGGSPAYSDGVVYIGVTNHYLYAINAQSGAIIWQTLSNATIARAYTYFFPFSTPVVFNNTVYWGAGPVYGDLVWYALDAGTGAQVWNITNRAAQTPDPDYRFLGNTPPAQTPVVLQWNNSISVMIIGEFLGVSIRDANDGQLLWRQFLGHEVYSSVAYANDSRGPKFYIGSNTYAVTCFNMTAAMLNQTAPDTVEAVYTTGSHVQSSAALWDGKLYVTSSDNNLYMFRDRAQNQINIFAASNKVDEMWNNETLAIEGQLQPQVTETGYGSFGVNGLPTATVILSVTKPDMTSENLTTTTDDLGHFSFSFNPTQVGEYGWVAFYEGADMPLIVYTEANTEFNTINVVQAPGNGGTTPTPGTSPTQTPSVTQTPTGSPQPTSTPTNGGVPVEYIYAAIIIIVVIVIVVAAYVFMRRK